MSAPERGIVAGDLGAALEDALLRALRQRPRSTRLERAPCVFTVQLRAGGARRASWRTATTLELMFKDLEPDRRSPSARARPSPSSCYDPLREIETYRDDPAPAQARHARLLRSRRSTRRGPRYWLFIENVRGRRAVADRRARDLGRRWRAGCGHCTTASPVTNAPRCRAPAALRRRLLPALAAPRARLRRPLGGAQAGARKTIEWLAERYDDVVERLAALPRPSSTASLCLERAGRAPGRARRASARSTGRSRPLGPGLIDLAALDDGLGRRRADRAGGRLPRGAHRQRSVGSRGASSSRPSTAPACTSRPVARLGAGLAAAAPHRRDWVGEALGIAERPMRLRPRGG